MVEILIDSIKDVVRVVPLLFVIFLSVDLVVLKLNKENGLLERFSSFDCLGGGLLGVIPQCGISVAFAKLYANGYISLGMLLAVFLAGSDEALIILGVHPEQIGLVALLLLIKIIVAVCAGYAINALIKEKRNRIKGCGIGCSCPRCRKSDNSVINNIYHTLKIAVFLVITVFLMNLGLERIGAEGFYSLLGKNSVFQPVIAAFIGAIPSCMSSVVLAEGYIQGGIGLGALIAGLCANTGYGILVVLKDLELKKAVKVLLLLFGVSILVGEIIFLIAG